MSGFRVFLMYDQLRLAVGRLPRFWKRIVLIAFDMAALAIALWASYALRYGSWLIPTGANQYVLILTAPVIALPVFVRMGLYRAVIRYLPERILWTVLQAMTIATVSWVVLVFLSEMSGRGVVPRSVPVLYWALGSIIIGGSRFAAKRILWSGIGQSGQGTPVAIYGAGEAGAELAQALQRQGAMKVIGFLDDSTALQGRDVAGVRVFEPGAIPMLNQHYGIKEIIVSMPSLSVAKRQDILRRISGYGVKIRTLPNLADLVSGKYLVNQIREIDIDDLLGRSTVPPDEGLVRQQVSGQSIMVTGGGGSIGSELCRLIAKWSPARLVIFEANEFALYQIERELARLAIPIVPVLGSIMEPERVRQTIRDHQIGVLFHAAAHKHIPLVEANALEGIRNNVFGTSIVAGIAFEEGVRSFVLISSDKAVRPTNVMGATKRWAELIVSSQALEASARASGQHFSAVRFGNVLGSNGSVVPLFKEQIANGGPITLTDPQMTRYFMSIHEAAELIVQSGALSLGGDVFLLEMGSPILVKDLAENMIKLAGFTVRDAANPSGDIEITVTGKRPGEKMFEELFYDAARAQRTEHPKIMRALQDQSRAPEIPAQLAALQQALAAQDEPLARRILFDFIKE